jgi:hypothetical protein
VRLPLDQHVVYAAEAQRLGMDFGSYLVWKLAQAHGLEPTESPSAERQQLGLPLEDNEKGVSRSNQDVLAPPLQQPAMVAAHRRVLMDCRRP